jgi:hypothetical protein
MPCVCAACGLQSIHCQLILQHSWQSIKTPIDKRYFEQSRSLDSLIMAEDDKDNVDVVEEDEKVEEDNGGADEKAEAVTDLSSR